MLDLDRIREKAKAQYATMTPVGMNFIVTVGNKHTWVNDELVAYVRLSTLENSSAEGLRELEDKIIHDFKHMHDGS